MSDLCIVCKKIVKERQEALMCEGGCESWQHRVCGIPIDRAFYRRLVKGEIEYQWTCNSCQIIDITPASPPLLPDDMLNFSSPAAESTHLDLLQIPVSSLEQTTGYDQPEPMDDYTVVESSSFQSRTNNILDTINDNSSFNVDNSYTVPLPIDESSIQELNDDSDFPMEEVSVRYTIITGGTTRARDKLVDTAGFSYTRKNPPGKATQYWCCYIRGKSTRCPATVIQKGGNFKRGRYKHCHQAEPGLHLRIDTIAKVCTSM